MFCLSLCTTPNLVTDIIANFWFNVTIVTHLYHPYTHTHTHTYIYIYVYIYIYIYKSRAIFHCAKAIRKSPNPARTGTKLLTILKEN